MSPWLQAALGVYDSVLSDGAMETLGTSLAARLGAT